MSDDSESKFTGDQPISERPYDLLNRAASADRIADLVDGLPTRVGLVVGVFGPLSSGTRTPVCSHGSRHLSGVEVILENLARSSTRISDSTH